MIVRLMVSLVIAIMYAGATQAGDVEDADAALRGKHYATAMKKFRAVAAKNDAYAQYQIGSLYNGGLGVKRDVAEAVRWFKLAAAQGNADAQFELALSYRIGQGVAQDYAEAVRWYKLAAEQGVTRAQLMIATSYQWGRGVVQDNVKAHMWFNLASVGSDTRAIEGRDNLEDKMTPQQILEAQRLARECQERNLKNCD